MIISNKTDVIKEQGSHRSGKSGKILKTFSSQGNQGKTGLFQDQGNFPTVAR